MLYRFLVFFVVIQLIVVGGRFNFWPFTAFDMFVDKAPEKIRSFEIVFKNETKQANFYDFSKVSYEIYKKYLEDEESISLQLYLERQTLFYQRKLDFIPTMASIVMNVEGEYPVILATMDISNDE